MRSFIASLQVSRPVGQATVCRVALYLSQLPCQYQLACAPIPTAVAAAVCAAPCLHLRLAQPQCPFLLVATRLTCLLCQQRYSYPYQLLLHGSRHAHASCLHEPRTWPHVQACMPATGLPSELLMPLVWQLQVGRQVVVG